MILKRNSRIVKWAYLLSENYNYPPRHTDLCTLFWRCVLWTPLKLIVIGAFLWMIGYVSWRDWTVPVTVFGVLFAGAFGIWLWAKLIGDRYEPGVLRTFVRDRKRGLCRMVEIKD